MKGYKCPMWARNDGIRGNFDRSGYEIDHIKEEYLRKGVDLNALFSLVYDDFIEYGTDNKKFDNTKIPSKIAISKLLKFHGFDTIADSQNRKYFSMTAKKLYNFYNKREWIEDNDEIHELYE